MKILMRDKGSVTIRFSANEIKLLTGAMDYMKKIFVLEPQIKRFCTAFIGQIGRSGAAAERNIDEVAGAPAAEGRDE